MANTRERSNTLMSSRACGIQPSFQRWSVKDERGRHAAPLKLYPGGDSRLKIDVRVFSPGAGFGFILQHIQAAVDVLARVMGHDDIVDIVARRAFVRGFVKGAVLFYPLGPDFLRVGGAFDLLGEDDAGGGVRAHDGYFGLGPGEHEVGARILTAPG